MKRPHPNLDAAFLVRTEFSNFLQVNLCPLKPAAVVDVERFPLGEHVQSCLTSLAVTVACAPRPTKRQLYLRPNGSGVHVNDASGDVAHGTEGVVDVGRVD